MQRLWPYLWAYYRIADRAGRSAQAVSDSLVELAHAEWQERPPTDGWGTWQDSAWIGLKSLPLLVSLRSAERNLFAPDNALTRKLQQLAASPLLDEMRQDFVAVFSRNADDVQALEAQFGMMPEELSYRGVVVIGLGIPKGVAWIGTAPSVDTWAMLSEERAVELYFPLKPFSPRPASPVLDGTIPEVWKDCVARTEWQDEIARGLLLATGYERVARGEYSCTMRRGNSTPEFVLVFPTPDVIRAVRLRQLRGELLPVSLVETNVVEEAARYFPWMWLDANDAILRMPGKWPSYDDTYAERVHLLMVIAILQSMRANAEMALIRGYWEGRHGSLDSLLRRLRQDKLVGPAFRDPDAIMTYLPVYEDWLLLHSGLRALARSVTDFMLDRADASILRSAFWFWHVADRGYATLIAELRWSRFRDVEGLSSLVYALLVRGNVAAAEEEIRTNSEHRQGLARVVQRAFEEVAQSREEERGADIAGVAIRHFRDLISPTQIIDRCRSCGWDSGADQCERILTGLGRDNGRDA